MHSSAVPPPRLRSFAVPLFSSFVHLVDLSHLAVVSLWATTSGSEDSKIDRARKRLSNYKYFSHSHDYGVLDND